MLTIPRYYYTKTDYSDLHKILSAKMKGHDIEIEEEPYNGKPIIACPLDHDLKDELHDYLLNFTFDCYRFGKEIIEQDEERLLQMGLDPILLRLEDWINVKVPYLPFEHFVYLPKGWLV